MNATAFDGVKPWPGQEGSGAQLADGRDARHDNQPPLEDRIAMQFEDQLRDQNLLQRITDITASAGRVPATINDETIAGKVGDLITQARTCRQAVEAAREVHNRPLLTAQRNLKGRADALLKPMDDAIQAVKRQLDAFMAEQARLRAEARRQADEQARIAREAAAAAAQDAAGDEPTAVPPPVIHAAMITDPVARGDMSRVGTRTVWRHEIEVPIAKLPKTILENEKVVEAINSVIAAQVRAGTRTIKGVRIWDEQVANVR